MIGYWFSRDGKLANGDGRKVVIGQTLTVDPPIELCVRGLHASEYPFDALRYANGALLYKVRLSGTIIDDDDKSVASERTALACRDASEMLRAFARQQALTVIHLWDAPEIVREYLKTGDENKRDAAGAAALAIARAASRAAAWAVPRAVTWDTAWAARSNAARKQFNTMVTQLFEEGMPV